MLIVNAEQYHFKNVTAAVAIDFATQSNLCIVTKNAPREICVWQTRKCTESNISCLGYQIPLLFQEIRDNNNNEKAIWNFFFLGDIV